MGSGARWYAIHTQPNNENRAEENLRRQGFATYLPRYLRRRRHGRRTDIVARPLFPRYMFVGLDVERDRWRAVLSTVGVSNLVGSGEKPIPLLDTIIDEIRAREDTQGFVMLSLPPGLKPGSTVRLVDGLFADCQGLLERSADNQRVAVLLSLLGRKVRVSVPVASVGAV